MDLISLYYHVALVVVDGYLNQCAQPDTHRLHESASDLLNLAAGKWAGSLHLWPKLFLHTALIAAISLPPEGEFSSSIRYPLLVTPQDCRRWRNGGRTDSEYLGFPTVSAGPTSAARNPEFRARRATRASKSEQTVPVTEPPLRAGHPSPR